MTRTRNIHYVLSDLLHEQDLNVRRMLIDEAKMALANAQKYQNNWDFGQAAVGSDERRRLIKERAETLGFPNIHEWVVDLLEKWTVAYADFMRAKSEKWIRDPKTARKAASKREARA